MGVEEQKFDHAADSIYEACGVKMEDCMELAKMIDDCARISEMIEIIQKSDEEELIKLVTCVIIGKSTKKKEKREVD